MSTSPRDTLAFIGGGQMATALIGGLLDNGWPMAGIRVADPDPATRRRLADSYPGLAVFADNLEAVIAAATWVLAVKPQQMQAVARGLAPAAQGTNRPLVLSIAAGTRIDDLGQWLGESARVIRCMPNRPALIAAGITGLWAGPGVTAAHRAQAQRVLGAVGSCVWLDDESQMDAVTAVSGSGPAYLFLLIEMLEAAAQREGLPAATARRLAVETLAGAAQMARTSSQSPAELRQSVTSPGGTTAAALAVLADPAWRETFLQAVSAARNRSAELASTP